MKNIPIKVYIKQVLNKKVSKMALKSSLQYIKGMAAEAKPRNGKIQINMNNAVVIQGPLLSEEHVVCIKATAERYGCNYLVLSTWEDTKKELLEKVSPFVDQIVLSKPPKNSGICNVNLQIISTMAGIKHARMAGAKYIIKTRVDTVIIKRNLFEYFKKWEEGGYSEYSHLWGLESRLMVFGGSKSILYTIPDFLMLGRTEDMIKYWNADNLDCRTSIPENRYHMTLNEIGQKQLSPEVFLSCRFAKSIGWNLEYTYQDYIEYLKKLFCVVNPQDIRWFWLKRPWDMNLLRKRSVSSYVFSQYDWLNMIMGNEVDISWTDGDLATGVYSSYDI